ncbi:MAG TPA: acyltransferase [Vicinamibacterales bacterium]|jgi:peptidoglycan/LPS O-acetylase OafA/YrhL
MTRRPDTGYVPALDGLRGVAILMVMLHHFTRFRQTSGFDGPLLSLLAFCWTGVDLFFVLSGFLITGILLDTRGSERYFTTFYARRFLRIFPLYYLVLLLSFVVLPRFPAVFAVLAGQVDVPTEEQAGVPLADQAGIAQWPYWLYLTNFSIADNGWTHGLLDVGWSLAIEEQFYLIWPLVIWLCPPAFVAWLCTGIFMAEVFARSFGRASEMAVLPIYVVTWFRLDGLVIGSLLAVAWRRGIMPALDRLVPAVVIVGVAGLIVCAIEGGHPWWWNRRMQQFGYSLIAVTAGAMLVSAISRPADSLWPRMLSAGWLRAFGKYSYALYLLHLPVMRAVREYVFNPWEFGALAPFLAQLLFYGAAIPAAFAVAWLSWRMFEAPILSLKARFPYSTRGSPSWQTPHPGPEKSLGPAPPLQDSSRLPRMGWRQGRRE